MHHLLPVLTPTVRALPHPEQRRKSLTTPATTPGQLGHLYPAGGLALLAPAGLAATAALWPASWAAASRTSSAARAPDNRAGRRASGVPPGEGCMYATTALPGTWRTRICRRPDAARRITHHKWPRTSTVRSAESPGSARTRVAQVENRSHSVSSVRSPSSLSPCRLFAWCLLTITRAPKARIPTSSERVPGSPSPTAAAGGRAQGRAVRRVRTAIGIWCAAGLVCDGENPAYLAVTRAAAHRDSRTRRGPRQDRRARIACRCPGRSRSAAPNARREPGRASIPWLRSVTASGRTSPSAFVFRP